MAYICFRSIETKNENSQSPSGCQQEANRTKLSHADGRESRSARNTYNDITSPTSPADECNNIMPHRTPSPTTTALVATGSFDYFESNFLEEVDDLLARNWNESCSPTTLTATAQQLMHTQFLFNYKLEGSCSIPWSE